MFSFKISSGTLLSIDFSIISLKTSGQAVYAAGLRLQPRIKYWLQVVENLLEVHLQ